MATISSNQITFIDLTDNRQLSVSLVSNVPACQIYDVNDHKFSPSWEYTNAILTPSVYLNSVQLPLSSTGLSISWTRRDGTDAEQPLSQDMGEYVLSNRIQITKNVLESSSGIITYICNVSYSGLTAQTQYSFCKVTTGKNADDARLLLSHTMLSSVETQTELLYPLTQFDYIEIFYHDVSEFYSSRKIRNNKSSQCKVRVEQSHIDTQIYYGANILFSETTAYLPNDSNIKMQLEDKTIYKSTPTESYIIVDAMYGLI